MVELGLFMLGIVLGMVSMAYIRATQYQRDLEARLRLIARYRHPVYYGRDDV